MSEVHGEGYVCGHCGKHFSKRKHLNSHMARIRNSKKKRTKHIFFEHEITPEDMSSVDGASSGEQSKEGELSQKEDDERWKGELLKVSQGNKRVRLNPDTIEIKSEV
jgi:hypothetical protein